MCACHLKLESSLNTMYVRSKIKIYRPIEGPTFPISNELEADRSSSGILPLSIPKGPRQFAA